MFDSDAILLGEIRCRSLLGSKGCCVSESCNILFFFMMFSQQAEKPLIGAEHERFLPANKLKTWNRASS